MCLLLWLAYAAARRVSPARMYRLVHVVAAYAPGPLAGWMFWLMWKMLSGS